MPVKQHAPFIRALKQIGSDTDQHCSEGHDDPPVSAEVAQVQNEPGHHRQRHPHLCQEAGQLGQHVTDPDANDRHDDDDYERRVDGGTFDRGADILFPFEKGGQIFETFG
jgi:hypothetical protein